MKESEIFLVDTNILIYAYEAQDSPRKNKAMEILKKCWESQTVLAVSNQNLAEFSCVALKKLKMDANTVKTIIKDISSFNSFKKISYGRKTIASAIEISEKNNMSFWDSLIAATMIEHGILNIYTENSKDFKLPSLNIVNPFC